MLISDEILFSNAIFNYKLEKLSVVTTDTKFYYALTKSIILMRKNVTDKLNRTQQKIILALF